MADGQADELEGLADELDGLAAGLEGLSAAIAARVAVLLRDEHVIPATLPAYIGEAIRRGNGGRAMFWHYPIPLAGPDSITTRWTLMADGGLHLELADSTGQQFWQGTFRPDVAAGSPAGNVACQNCPPGTC